MRRNPAVFCLLLLVWSIPFLNGCATGRFTPETLPQHYLARQVYNVKKIDLTKLASSTEPVDVIGRGDIIDVTISAGLADDDAPLKLPMRVTQRGDIDIPFLGRVPVSGLRMPEAEADIARVCVEKQCYRSPTVTVEMKQPKMNRVEVVGAVEKPGVYELRAGKSDLLHALTQAGGLAKNADTTVEIRHPGYRNPTQRPPSIAQASGVYGETTKESIVPPSGERTLHVDLISLAKNKANAEANDLDLEDGAVVHVDQLDPDPITIGGLVHTPKRMEVPFGKNVHFLDAISEAGEVSNQMADKCYVIRHRQGQEPAVIEVNISDAEKDQRYNLLLEPGDVVRVEETAATWMWHVVEVIGFNITKPFP